jgi:hypothetical protein
MRCFACPALEQYKLFCLIPGLRNKSPIRADGKQSASPAFFTVFGILQPCLSDYQA